MFALSARSSSRDASSNEPLPPPFPNVMELSGTILEAVTSEAVGAYGVEVGGADDFLVRCNIVFRWQKLAKAVLLRQNLVLGMAKAAATVVFRWERLVAMAMETPTYIHIVENSRCYARVCVLTWTPYDLTDGLT